LSWALEKIVTRREERREYKHNKWEEKVQIKRGHESMKRDAMKMVIRSGEDSPYREEAPDFWAVFFGEVVGEDEAVVGAADVVVELRTIEAPPALMT